MLAQIEISASNNSPFPRLLSPPRTLSSPNPQHSRIGCPLRGRSKSKLELNAKPSRIDPPGKPPPCTTWRLLFLNLAAFPTFGKVGEKMPEAPLGVALEGMKFKEPGICRVGI